MTQTIALVDYGAGNIKSISNALAEAARRADIAAEITLTHDPDRVAKADGVVLPGVGAFGACAQGVAAVDGLQEALTEHALTSQKKFLGVCVGMQLLATKGLEHRAHPGFNWIPGVVDRLAPADPALKIPHMGWNTVRPAHQTASAHPVLSALQPGAHVYFVHSFAISVDTPADAALTTDYGGLVTAAVARDAMVGVQFHPEKSQAAGLALLSAFLKWTP